MRNLATIQTIASITPHNNADSLDIATVLGWQCVVKRGEFSPGDKCVYFEIDSVLPQDVPALQFMASAGYRVRTIKLRGHVSQGLAMPMSCFPWLAKCEVGTDVSNMIGSGVTKFETVEHCGNARGSFPAFIRKTDEPRIQTCAGHMKRLYADELWYATEKLDGCSFTAYWDGTRFGVCSHNLDLEESESNAHWAIARKLNLPNKLPLLGIPTAIQGELVGPKIQGNKYGLTDNRLYLFSAWDIDSQRYEDVYSLANVAQYLGVPVVPMHGQYMRIDFEDVPGIVAMATGQSVIAPVKREGLVFRTVDARADSKYGHASFKAINPEFLLKHGE